MTMMKRFWIAVFAIVLTLEIGVGLGPLLHAQGTLSQQVLQLLTRVNTWIGTNTFTDLRMANTAIPSTTTFRIYADPSGNLYFNGGLIAGAGGGVTPHNLLSTTHADTVAGAPVRGGVIVANSTPAWAQLAKCTTGYFLGASATDTVCSNDATQFINIPGANITGTLAAISGVNLTALNATQLTSGTVPLARLSGLTNTQLSGAAGITYANLALGGNLVNADINAAAAIAYSKLSLAGAILNTDIANTQITFAKWASNGCNNGQFAKFNGIGWICYNLVASDVSGGGTVTSVALSLPAFITVSGSPVTTSGTLTGTLASQTANFVFAAPNGAGGAPTFRALVNADFPASGVSAGTYNQVTVNAQGVVTGAAAANTIALGTVTSSTPLNITETWNSGGVTFTGILENITSTASAAGSLLMDLQVASSSKWKVDKSGNETIVGNFVGVAGTFSGLLSANLGLTVPTGQTAVVTDTDALTLGSNKIPNTLTVTCTGLTSVSLSGDCEFIADRAYQVTAIKFVQYTAGGAGCVADIEKLTSTTAPGSGTVMGTGSYDCNATANNTVTTYTLTGTTATLQLAAGNRMGIKLGGSLTALKGLTATVTLKAI